MPDATDGATADALSAALAQMQFLEDARNTIRQLKIKPDDAQEVSVCFECGESSHARVFSRMADLSE